MNYEQVLMRLESYGSAQTRKTYGRHGVLGPMFGVKHGDLNKLVREIKTDHDLALELWDSGNFDARVLASMIADPCQMTVKTLTAWAKIVDHHGLSVIVSNVAQRSPVAVKMMRKWMARKGELIASTGWQMVVGIARENPEALTKVEYRDLMSTIEAEIHGARNRVRYSMNLALVSIGTHVLEKEAIKIAGRIGEVDVDHGDTSCKTISAVPYIKKAAAHQRAKAAKKAAKQASCKR